MGRVEASLRGVVRSGDRLLVGLSGGPDSMVLLDVLARIARRRRIRLSALHVNHQLSPNAAHWARFCRAFCRARGIPLRVAKVTVARGDSIEARAGGLQREEKKILQLAESAMGSVTAHGGSFIRRFWGYEPHVVAGGASSSVRNGPHIANRVGHVQGGILLGLAADTACAALPASWALTGVSAWYISPGEGRTLKARSKILHHGRLTAVVRTQVTGKNNRRVLEVVTTHAHHSA